jgi:rubredoxin
MRFLSWLRPQDAPRAQICPRCRVTAAPETIECPECGWDLREAWPAAEAGRPEVA